MAGKVLSKGNYFDPTLVADLVNKVKGRSSLAKLSRQEPIPFNGSKEFIFSMDSEVDIVAENGKKTPGGVSIDPIVIQPIKIEYGARVSDEFMFASEENKIEILKAFNEGFARKVARGLDLMAMHGLNPRTNTASAVIGENHFDAQAKTEITYDAADPEANIEAAVAAVHAADGNVTGLAMAPAFSGALATIKVNGVKQFPELAWGANPQAVNGLSVDVNRTVSDGANVKDRAILGDFADMFKWGYAKRIPLEVIRYGDPDNSGNDLRGYNQVYVRAELFLGWSILDGTSFARVIEAPGG